MPHQEVLPIIKMGAELPEPHRGTADGTTLNASAFAGKKLVPYFYPQANTPGCTAEACSLNDGLAQLNAAGIAVVGGSKDSAESHRKFTEKFSLGFPLIADTELSLNQAFGVWQKKKMAGREYMGTVRTTFIIDENGIVEDIITKVQTKDSANQILKLKK